jgi:hypothetical protein
MSASDKILDVYKDRITCFIDILGFSRDVESIDANTSVYCFAQLFFSSV